MNIIDRFFDWLERNLQPLVLIFTIILMLALLIITWAQIARDQDIKERARKIQVAPNYLE